MFNLIKSIKNRDPAANNYLEIIFLYPGLHAVFFHRIANLFWLIKLYFIAKTIAYISRLFTGIEIHPAAKIGKNLFIDHGLGVVIGETSKIGNNVTLYHAVTLGGVSPSIDSNSQRLVKRHPTLKDEVVVGSGAQILGPIVVEENAIVGANAVVTKDVPKNAVMVGIPAKNVNKDDNLKDKKFRPYGIATDLDQNN